MRELVTAAVWVMLCGCTVGDGDGEQDGAGDDPDDSPLVLAAGDTCPRNATIKLAQVNICEGGRWQNCVTDRRPTWGTQEELADRMRSADLAGVEVLGTEEMPPDAAARMADALNRHTGTTWDYRAVPMGKNGTGSGVAIFWRTNAIRLAASFGYTVAERIGGYADGQLYSLRFMGLLLEDIASGKRFGMFTGKTAWGGYLADNRTKIDNARRGVQANRVKAWIREKMAPYPDSSIMLTIDTTAHGTPSWAALNEKFSDGNPSFAGTIEDNITDPQHRYDQVFYDHDSGRKRDCGFVAAPRRSGAFGSDHRFVWATVAIK
jgi:hypothetical protein